MVKQRRLLAQRGKVILCQRDEQRFSPCGIERMALSGKTVCEQLAESHPRLLSRDRGVQVIFRDHEWDAHTREVTLPQQGNQWCRFVIHPDPLILEILEK